VKPSSGPACQVVQELVRLEVVAVERDGVDGNVGAELGLLDDRLRRL